MNFNALDFVFIAILFIFTFRGLIRGLIDEIFGFGSLIIPLFAAFAFYSRLASAFAPSVDGILANILGFVSVFIIAFIFLKLIQHLIKAVFSGKILGSLDRTLGLLLGFVEGAALIFLVIFILTEANGIFNSDSLRDGSVITNLLLAFKF